MTRNVFRPHLDDVERLSQGKGAKKQRGTGSRMVCHRLNQDERKLYEFAKQASILTMRGTMYRKNRKGSPLSNIFRQRCDALEEICIIIEKRTDLDTVLIDFSTLRVPDDEDYVSLILNNVFKAKYPELYDNILKGLDANTNANTSASGSDDDDNDIEGYDVVGNRNDVFLALFNTPIDWEAVKTKAIWGIDERLITISCERDVAKSLAVDVLKESSNFKFHVDNHDDDEIILTDDYLLNIRIGGKKQ